MDELEGLGAGRAVDEKIARHLAGVYAEQLTAKGRNIDGAAVTADSVWADPRVAMMLLQEGSKCKEVLSANTERQIVVEGLPTPDGGLEGSLRTELSRQELEDLTAHVIEGWVDVVREALAQVCVCTVCIRAVTILLYVLQQPDLAKQVTCFEHAEWTGRSN